MTEPPRLTADALSKLSTKFTSPRKLIHQQQQHKAPPSLSSISTLTSLAPTPRKHAATTTTTTRSRFAPLSPTKRLEWALPLHPLVKQGLGVQQQQQHPHQPEPPLLPTPSPTSATTSDEADLQQQQRSARILARHEYHDDEPDDKPYLTAGLYWNEAALAASSSSSSSALLAAPRPAPPPARKPRRTDLDWRTIDDPQVLPLPIYYGDVLLEEERDFYPSWAILQHGDKVERQGKGAFGHEDLSEVDGDGSDAEEDDEQVQREESRKPPPYRRIPKNHYFERRPEKSDMDSVCACLFPADPDEKGCGIGCINRLMQYTCNPKTCPLGDRCSNGRLGMRTSIPEGKDGLKIIWTGDRGFGLKTMVPIARGQFIMEYRGEIINRDEAYHRVLTTYKDAKSYYFLDYDGHEVIDAGQRGNASRFINHSCGPNVHVVSWKLGGFEEYQMGIFALHDIPANTELTYDYGWQDFSAIPPNPNASPILAPTDPSSTAVASTSKPADPARQKCYCGAPVCSGFLGGKKKVAPPPLSGSTAATSKDVMMGKGKGKATMAVQVTPKVVLSQKRVIGGSAGGSAAKKLKLGPGTPSAKSNVGSSLSGSPSTGPPIVYKLNGQPMKKRGRPSLLELALRVEKQKEMEERKRLRLEKKAEMLRKEKSEAKEVEGLLR